MGVYQVFSNLGQNVEQMSASVVASLNCQVLERLTKVTGSLQARYLLGK
jgi:hypothetical protein